ncbi:MAG TPA: ABC transporter permease [Pirellulales bacterium]|nr:ABC transporter permease [Pirellulales bacterium]
MRLISLVYKNIARRRIRSALTVTGMAVAVAAVVALVGIADGFKRSFLDMYQAHGVDVVVVRGRSADRMTSELDQGIGAKIATIPHVTAVEPVLLDVVSLEELGPVGVVVQGLEPTGALDRGRTLSAGTGFGPEDKKVALLGRILAANLGKSVGDEIEIYENERFRIVGIYDGGNIFENGAMIVPLVELQRMLDQSHQVTAFNVRVDRASGADAVPDVVQAINGLGVGVSAMATENYVATDSKIQIASAMAWSISAIALVIGAVGMLNTMIVSVFERTSEIGILRAIGWRRGRIVRMIILEAGLLSIAGGVIGTLLALGMTQLLSRAPTTAGLVSGYVAPGVIVQGLCIAVLIGILGAIYPAIRAAQLLPTVALRGQG